MGGQSLKKQVGLRFEPKLLNAVDKFAAKKKMSRTEFVERAVRMAIASEIKRERALDKAE
ncbi:YlcI/YnfO family protein [Priestia megaterium]